MSDIKINNKTIFTHDKDGLHIGDDYPTGAIVAAHYFDTDDDLAQTQIMGKEQITTDNNGDTTNIIFKRTFIKQFETSKLISYSNMHGQGNYSYICGVGLVIDPAPPAGTDGMVTGSPTDERGTHNWDHGISYDYRNNGVAYAMRTAHGIAYWTNISKGEHVIGFGWNSSSAGAGDNKPFDRFNSDSVLDARQTNGLSSLLLMEIK